jgi:hypothetical protein
MRVELVQPTAAMLAPENERMSGIRKESPISTSSPLETITSRPAAVAASASSTAAALLFTTSAACAPVIWQMSHSTCVLRPLRAPFSGEYSRVL